MQIEIPEAFGFLYEGQARYRAAYGGRGSAKSHSFATAALLRAYAKPERILCCREVQKSIKESVKQLFDDKIKKFCLDTYFESTQNEIRGVNGSLIRFAGLQTGEVADPVQSIKSMEGLTLAWVEEANTVSQRSLDLLTPTVREPNSEIWFTWNPRWAKDPVDQMFRGGEKPPRTECHRVNWQDNPWFPDVLRQEMEWARRRDPDKYAHVWLGEYARQSEASVFRNWRIDTLDIPSGARPYFGADWGFSVDPTVLVRCWAWERTLYVDREVYAVGCDIDRTPALFDKMNDERTADIRKWPIIADSARPETISYMRRHGFDKIESARKGPGSIEDGIEFLKSHDIVVHPSCKHTSDELTMYSYKTDKRTEEVLPELEDKKNHVIDALRYAVEKIRRTQHVIPAEIFIAGRAREVIG